ncbi:hypothetical protein F4802DRAFT_615329 [Xylaria palmicola]|nr:hypothetical protein F4802DRAFT_615329 [Xylaria palmicola]
MRKQGNPSNSTRRDLDGPWRPGFADPRPSRVALSISTAQSHAPAQISPNYRGDLSNPRNQIANIPESENCSTWWVGLPANCTYGMLFDSMRNVGAVSHAFICPPGKVHTTSAAKVEFFERASVDRLLDQQQQGHLRVGGREPYIKLNRIKVAPHSNESCDEQGNKEQSSRVLQVTGDERIVNREHLKAVLDDPNNRLSYGLESAEAFALPDGLGCVEFRFASYVVQALRVRHLFMSQERRGDISEEERSLWEGITISFGPDPCE